MSTQTIAAINRITTDPKWDSVFTLLGASDVQLSGDQHLDTIKLLYITSMEELVIGQVSNRVKKVNACMTISKFTAYLTNERKHMISWKNKVAHITATASVVQSFHVPVIALCDTLFDMLKQPPTV